MSYENTGRVPVTNREQRHWSSIYRKENIFVTAGTFTTEEKWPADLTTDPSLEQIERALLPVADDQKYSDLLHSSLKLSLSMKRSWEQPNEIASQYSAPLSYYTQIEEAHASRFVRGTTHFIGH